MTRSQVEKVLGAKVIFSGDASGDEAVCADSGWPGGKAYFMFTHYHLSRIDVDKSRFGITTAEGADIGMTEAQLRKIYGRRAAFTDHPYLEKEGHYVTVHYPKKNRELIFETYHGKVTSFRIGLPGPVNLIEACA